MFREMEEVALAPFPHAVHIPMGEIPVRLSELDPEREVLGLRQFHLRVSPDVLAQRPPEHLGRGARPEPAAMRRCQPERRLRNGLTGTLRMASKSLTTVRKT